MRATTSPQPFEPIELTVPFRAHRLVAAALAIAVAATTVGLTVPFGRADAATAESVTGRISGKADRSDANGVVDKAVTSGYGRFVAFTGGGNDFVPGLPSSTNRVYVRDTLTDSLEVASVDANGAPAASSRVGAITPDGRFVAFVSYSKLVPADTNEFADVYVRDRKLGTNDLVSVSSAEALGDAESGAYGSSAAMDISDDGRYVAFETEASNFAAVGGDTNNVSDIYRRDRKDGVTTRVSVNGATGANGTSIYPTMSADGVTVVFASLANNLVASDTNGAYDIFLKRLDGSANVKVSQGLDAHPNSYSNQPEVSANGNLVVFTSAASDLVASDSNSSSDVFLRNVSAGTTTRVSVWTGGGQINGPSEDASISPDGSRITFETAQRVDVSSDPDLLTDVYLREGTGTTRVSIASGAADSSHTAFGSAVSDDTVVFRTGAAMAPVDGNGLVDAYVRRTPFIGPHTTFAQMATTTQQRILGTADPAKVTAAVAAIRAGASPEHQITGLVDQPVFSAKKAPVTRLYWAYFKRRPDLSGLNYWIKQYANGKPLQKISLQFAMSNEFKTKYGNTTSTQFVTLVYQNVLERQPEVDGLAYWAKKIDNGTSRGQVMTSFSESSEGKRVMAPYVDSVLIGLGMLGTIPAKTLFDGTVSAMKQGQPKEIVVDYILGYPDYAATL